MKTSTFTLVLILLQLAVEENITAGDLPVAPNRNGTPWGTEVQETPFCPFATGKKNLGSSFLGF
ncbi:MAG: hypothetical protein ABI557_17180, partial [Aureliella sp.]